MQNYELRTSKKKDKTKEEREKPVRGFAVNTMGKQLAILKVFLNAAYKQGLTKNDFHKSEEYTIISEESEAIYLNETELQKIYDIDLTQFPRLEKVRDLFIVGSWTGLRFSDLIQVSPEKIIDDLIYITQQKTKGKVVIPTHWTVKKILEKYSGELPRKISNQKMNDYIKEVCEMAEINEEIHKTTNRGGLKVSKKYKKWELVSTHTARRSFATNLYKQGFPAISIMKITGHTTEKAFLKYIKVTPDEHAKLLQMHWQNLNKLRVV
jgi:integrase